MIVLPMAGLSSRFFKAGYTVPKYMLPLRGSTVFAHALCSFSNFFGAEPFLIICRDISGAADFVRAECLKMNLPAADLHLVVLDHETGGQADTVAYGLEQTAPDWDSPLTIFNIDTFRPSFRHPTAFDITAVDGYVEVFEGAGTHWSFVRPDLTDTTACRAAEVAEKLRISDYCSTGLYYFRSVAFFRALYETIAGQDPACLQGGERYIAPLYNTAIKKGYDIRYRLIRAQEVQFCGTPDDYETLRINFTDE